MVSAAYLAGLFDGEGCIYVFEASCKRKHGVVKQMMARFVIANTHLPTLEAIKCDWGGFVTAVKSNGGSLPNYRLDISGHESLLNVLKAMQPYLIVKRDQVDLFLADYAPTIRLGKGKFTPLTPEQHAKRVEVRDKLAALKKISYYGQETNAVQ